MVCIVGGKSKLNSAFSIRWLRVLLLRHFVIIVEVVLPRFFESLGGLNHSVVDYVIEKGEKSIDSTLGGQKDRGKKDC